MSSISLAPGLEALIGGNAEVKAEVVKAAAKILESANSIVPVDTGALQESGHVEVSLRDGHLIARVTYSTEYAVFVEFGTSDTPTFAMLRRGAESAGFSLSKGR